MIHLRSDWPARLRDHEGKVTSPACTHRWEYNPTSWDYEDLGPLVITAYCRTCKAIIRFERAASDAVPGKGEE